MVGEGDALATRGFIENDDALSTRGYLLTFAGGLAIFSNPQPVSLKSNGMVNSLKTKEAMISLRPKRILRNNP